MSHIWHDAVHMSTSKSRRSRVFTVSFPETLAKEVDEVAREESRNVSELFREAFRKYQLERLNAHLVLARRAARKRSQQREYGETDVERLVDELRSKSDVRKNRR